MWWSGAGSNRRPSAFQEAAFLQAGGPDRPEHATRVRHHCLATIDLGSLAGSSCAARSESAAVIAPPRPVTAFRYRCDAAGEACPRLPLRRRVGTVAVDAPLAISTAMRQHGAACRFEQQGESHGTTRYA